MAIPDAAPLAVMNRIDCQVNAMAVIRSEDGLITVSDDKTLKVWLKRDNGQYWPSICHNLPDAGYAIAFDESRARLFVGLNIGLVEEFTVAEDFNSISRVKDFYAHEKQVTDLIFAPAADYVISCSRDKYMQYFNASNGQRIGRVLLESQALALALDALTNHVFVGEYNGTISMFHISDTEYKLINTLKGHEGSIRQLLWEPELKWLFSCSFDETVIIWDIGGMKGESFELRFHTGKINAMGIVKDGMKLMTGSEDRSLVFWDLACQRQPPATWEESDKCQMCAGPFFWSFKQMYADRTMGKRQHHCRKCGKALCGNCCKQVSPLPKMGYEMPQRLCQPCHDSLTPDDTRSLARKHNIKYVVNHMLVDEQSKLIVLAGRDNLVKFIDLESVLAAAAAN